MVRKIMSNVAWTQPTFSSSNFSFKENNLHVQLKRFWFRIYENVTENLIFVSFKMWISYLWEETVKFYKITVKL